MASNYIQLARSVMGNPSFHVILEAVLADSMISLTDWENNSTKYNKDETEKSKSLGDVQLDANDFVNTHKSGDSISRSKYLFLPTTFALNPADGVHILTHISELIKNDGHITVSVRPGFGVEDEQTAYPAGWYKNFTADSRHLVTDQLGSGSIIYAINGIPLSQWLKKTASANVPITATPKTEWLTKIVKSINDAQSDIRVKSEKTRIPGFSDLESDYRILSTTTGDSILLISPNDKNAAYILKKKMLYNGVATDYDSAAYELMSKFIADWRRKPRGTKKENIPVPNLEEKRKPRLRFRDWLDNENNINGYALRRDYHTDSIENLVKGGINYADGKKLKDEGTPTATQTATTPPVPAQ